MSKDEGPSARLKAVRDDPSAISVIFQRIAAGETLGDIQRSWALPRIQFFNWLCAEYPEQYAGAIKARSDPRLRSFLINRAWLTIGLPIALLPGEWHEWTVPGGGPRVEYRASIDDCGSPVLTIRAPRPCMEAARSAEKVEGMLI